MWDDHVELAAVCDYRLGSGVHGFLGGDVEFEDADVDALRGGEVEQFLGSGYVAARGGRMVA
ncbi:hypothetical protein ACWDFL_37840 [Streptomyces bungoensis]